MGGPDKVKRQHDGGKLTVRERIERLLDAGSWHEIGALTGVARYGADGATIEDFTPANLVTGRGRLDGRPVVVAGDDFTVRGGANDAGIKGKLLAVRAHGARPAPADDPPGRRHRRRRLGEEPRAARLLADAQGLPVGHLDRQPGRDPGGVARARLGGGAGLGARGGEPLLGDGEGVLAAVRRRAAGGGAHPPPVRQERARRQPHPHPQRCGRRRGGERGGGLCARAALPFLPAELGLRAAGSRALRRRPGAARCVADRGGAARSEEGLPHAPHRRRAGRQGLVLRDRAQLGPADHHRPGAPFRLAGGADGGRPDALRRRLDREGLGEDHPLRRPGAGVPPAGGAPGRRAGLPDRPRRRARRDDPLRHARRERGAAIERAVVLGAGAQSLRRRRRGAPELDPLLHAHGLALGRMGLAADRRRAGGGLPRRDRGRARRRGQAGRDRGAHPPLRLADAQRREVRRRGDHRPARHAAAVVRVRRARGAFARRRARCASACGPEPRRA